MNKQILKLAIPNIITNITVPLLGMTDTAIAGHMESELYIGAIAVSSIIFNFIYWNFGFLRMGTSGFTAQALGAGNEKETVFVLLRSMFTALCAGVLIILLQLILLKLAFLFIDASAQTKSYISEYFLIYIWAAPFVLSMYALTGWFIGMQDAKTPMFISIFTNLLNIALSVIFVFLLGMQLKGLALAIALAQLTAFCTTLIVLNAQYGHLKKYISFEFLKNLNGFKIFFKVNSDIFLRSAALITVTVFFTAASAKMGDTILAVNSLLMQLFILFSYMMDGFAYAAEALSGKYYGAGDFVSLKKIIRRLFAWGVYMTIAFTLLYIAFTNNILSLLTDKTNIAEAAKDYRLWAVLFPLAGFAAFLWDGIFIGITASRQMRNSMFIAVICFFTLYIPLKSFMGNNALWMAFISYLAIRGLIQTTMYAKMQNAFGLKLKK